jgi:hypothetical protein
MKDFVSGHEGLVELILRLNRRTGGEVTERGEG